MSDTGNNLAHLISELRRRKTFRIAATYIVVGWVLIEGASVVLPAFSAPAWILPALIITVVAGLPIAIVLSWIFDITPDGVQKTDDIDAAAAAEAANVPTELQPSIAIPLGSAERRQVSLLRCSFDLVSDGKVVTDPEMILSVLPELNALMNEVADRFSGYPLDVSGPVFEFLFGYPVAYENDSVRAVTSAFAILVEMQKLELDDFRDPGLRLSCKSAIHSDLVIIEDAADEDAAATIVGSSSAVAGWLQTLAPADSIVLSDDTRRLLRDSIRCELLGEHSNPQTGEQTEVHQAVMLLSPKDRLSSHRGREMIGRDTELALALSRWEQVLDGEDQFVVLRGEPGIGKSTLVSALITTVRETESAQLMPVYCSPFETNTAFHPIVDFFLGPGLRLRDADSDAHRARRVSRLLAEFGLDIEAAGPLLATLLESDATRDDSGQHSESAEAMRASLFNCLLDLFHGAAQRGPMCLIFEDIHWADPSTLELISMLVKRESRAGVLFLFTTRPTLKLDWESRSNVTVLDLQKLPRRVTETLVRDVLGDTKLPENILQKIVSETDGNPLFVEELSKAVAESISESDNAPADNLVLPGTVQQSLASRIDRLNEAKPVLQLCSLLGRKFDYQLLRAVSQTENEAALRDELRTIVNAEFLFQEGAVPDSIYRFKHVLMQETAHNSLLKATRVELHAHVADIIESEFPERAERNPALLGFHYGEGEQAEKAVRYWTNACRKSLELFALREAIKQAQSGLQILQSLPDSSDRDAAEIRLRSMLGKGLLALHGYADSRVEETFSRALELSESVENAPELFQVVVGLWMYFVIGGEAEHALVVARRLVRIADANPSVAKSLQAHYSVGHSLYRLGRYRESLEALENALSFAESEADFASESASGDDTRVHVHCVLAHVFWHLGDDERSASHITNALDMATRQENLWGIEFSSFMGAWLFMLRREPEQTAGQAERTLAIAEENGFEFWRSVGTFMATWASHDAGHSAEPDDAATRLTKLEETVTSFLAAGALNGTTSLGLQVAEDLVAAGEIDRAEFWLTKARDIVESSGERSFAPDLLRIEGQIARERGDTDRAEALFAAAESAARQVGSIGLARRAAAELVQGKGIATTVQEAREPLH